MASSDFDLKYNGGALQVLDLVRLRSLVPRACTSDDDCGSDESCDVEPTVENSGIASHWCVPRSGPHAGRPCGPWGEKDPATRWIQPGRCGYVDPTRPQDGGPSLVVDAVGIGAFATDVVYRSRPPAEDGSERPGGRLFLPVRGDATLHWIDVDDDSKILRSGFELDCGQAANRGDCDEHHRSGDDPEQENTRGLRMPPEPYGIDASADGRLILVTHQTEGAVSLFVNRWDQVEWQPPRLEFVLEGLPTRPIGIAAVPEPALVLESERLAAQGLGAPIQYQPGFLVSFRNAAMVKLLRYFSDRSSDDPSNPSRPFLVDAGSVYVTTNAAGYDSRGLALDAGERQACETDCPPEASEARLACLRACAGIPLGVYLTNRSPDSLIVGQTRTNQSPTASDDLPRFYDSIPLPTGPCRVVVADVIDVDGWPSRRVFVVSFDQRKIAIYDPSARRIEKWIQTGRGPYALVVDLDPASNPGLGVGPSYALGYLAHFSDSYLAVVDLDRRHSKTYGEIVLTIGRATPPRAAK